MTGHCAECGFTYDEDAATEVPGSLVAGAAEFVSVLTAAGQDPRSRRQPAVWSPLEYGCHVRDVLLVQRERVLLARRVDRPDCVPMGRDERVAHDGYADQEPAAVARQLADAASLFAGVLGRLAESDWRRTVRYGYPEPAERSLRWVAVHTLHEVRHHLRDVRRQLG